MLWMSDGRQQNNALCALLGYIKFVFYLLETLYAKFITDSGNQPSFQLFSGCQMASYGYEKRGFL